MDCNQAGDSRSLSVDAAYQVARAFGWNHKDINIFRRYDFVKVNIKSVVKHQRMASFQIRGDTLFKNCCLKLVSNQNHDDNPRGCGFGSLDHVQSLDISLY